MTAICSVGWLDDRHSRKTTPAETIAGMITDEELIGQLIKKQQQSVLSH